MQRRVATTIRRRRLLDAADCVAVAVSGGPDSVALAWILTDLAARASWQIAGFIHVNHGLRGAESDADEAFCRDLAGRLGWPIVARRVDARAAAERDRRSIEAAARDLRYAEFEAGAAELAATVVATGHTADDQAETVLLRLLSGAGTRGLSGVRPRRGPYRRPLIDCRRDELTAWLVARGESFRTDASNDDPSVPRNRLRRDLLPVIERIAPGGVAALTRLADLAADDEAVLESQATEWLSKLVSKKGGLVQVDAAALAALPAAIGRRVARALAAEVAPGARLGAEHLETVRQLAASEKTGGRLDLPGMSARRQGASLLVGPAGSAPAGSSAGFAYELPVPGTVELPELGAVMRASMATAPPEELAATATIVALQASEVTTPLVVRSRRPGDRLRPLGSPGRRKVQDLLVDRKVSRQDRDRVAIVTDASGRVVWVAGVTIDDRCRVTTPETGVVVLELRKSQ